MATRIVQVCDFPGCDRGAEVTFEGATGRRTYAGDFCATDWPVVERRLAELGITARAARVDSKARKVYTTASGRPFSTAEARQWLVDQELIEQGGGRLSKRLLEAYAEAH